MDCLQMWNICSHVPNEDLVTIIYRALKFNNSKKDHLRNGQAGRVSFKTQAGRCWFNKHREFGGTRRGTESRSQAGQLCCPWSPPLPLSSFLFGSHFSFLQREEPFYRVVRSWLEMASPESHVILWRACLILTVSSLSFPPSLLLFLQFSRINAQAYYGWVLRYVRLSL